jgi:hypothetical protein
MSQDTTVQTPVDETENFVVVTSDRPQEAAPQPEVKADEQKPAEGQGSAPVQTSQGEEEKHEGRLQKRFDRLTAAKGDAERRAEAAERKLAELSVSKPDSSPSGDKEPEIEEFETWDAYSAAKSEWEGKHAKQAEKPAEPKPEPPAAKPEEKISPELAQALSDSAPSFIAARTAHPDFDQVIGAKDLQAPDSVVILIADTSNPGEVAYWLGTHKDEAARIAGLSMIKQAKALSDIEVKINEAPPAKRTTKAPPPINPLSGNDSSPTGYHPGMTQAEFEAWESSQNTRGSGGWL